MSDRTLKVILAAVAAFLMVLIAGAIGAGLTPRPAPAPATITVTQTPVSVPPAPSVTTDDQLSPEPAPSAFPDDVQRAAMEAAWSTTSPAQKQSICDGWQIAAIRPDLLDAYMQSAPQFDRDKVEAFFTEKCK